MPNKANPTWIYNFKAQNSKDHKNSIFITNSFHNTKPNPENNETRTKQGVAHTGLFP